MASARSSGAAAGQLGSLYSLGAVGSLTDGQLLERFLTRDDPATSEAAFTALVDRHGTMVLSVCRRELGDLHDAHDAFQATFLVLMSKASTIRRRESVGGWLFGIARRVAARARVDGARRRRHLEQFGAGRTIFEDGPVDPSPVDAELDYAPLIAEVDRLPERFRAPVVLHYFEGLSAEATAQRLGCARGTVLSRLSRARHRIKRRLEQQGVSYPALIPFGGPMIRWLPPTPVPAWLAHSTVRAVSSMGLAGAAMESVVPVAVASLSRGVARTLILARVGVAAALLVCVAAGVSIGLAATLKPDEKHQQNPGMEKARAGTEKASPPRGASDTRGAPVVVRGQVLDPDGKPAAGASLHVLAAMNPDDEGKRLVKTAGPDGRFALTIGPRPGGLLTSEPFGIVVAQAPGFALDWASFDPSKTGGAITLRLRRDEVPIEGRIVSLEGRPIPGLKVNLEFLHESSPASIDELRRNGGQAGGSQDREEKPGFGPSGGEIIPSTRTDSDGRFRMTGFGHDRGVLLAIEGQSIEKSFALVQTSADRDFKPITLQYSFCGARRIDGPRFEMAVSPGRRIEGLLRDAHTGRPVAGARVNNGHGQILTTDAHGRFEFEGLPRTGIVELAFSVPGQPYVDRFVPVQGAEGLRAQRMDFILRRGVWVEGRVVNRAIGRPVPAILSYYPLSDNPHFRDYPGALFLKNSIPHLPLFPTDANGRFRAAVPPGGGLLTVKSLEPGYRGAPPYDSKATGPIVSQLDINSDLTTHHAYVPIDVSADKGLIVPDIALDSSRTQHLRVTDAEGRPVKETWMYCLQGGHSQGSPLAGDEFIFHHDNPGKALTVMIVHQGRSLGGAVNLKGDEPDPMRIVLQPTGTVTGRLLDEDGKPRANAGLSVNYSVLFRGEPILCSLPEPLSTGPDGRFRIEHLVPGVGYAVVVKKNEKDSSDQPEWPLHKDRWTVKPGEVQDWGDVRVPTYGP